MKAPAAGKLGSATEWSTTSRLEAGNFALHDIGSDHAKGLGIVTQAIHDTDVEIGTPATIATAFKAHTGKYLDLSTFTVKERNVCLAALVRDKSATSGWIAGWECLVQAAPNVGLHPRIVEDVKLASAVYARLRSRKSPREPIDVRMIITPLASNDSLYEVGPKSLGGTAWRQSKEYAAVLERKEWRDPGYSKGFSPCVAYGWIAVQIKVIPAKDSPDAMRLQLLNIIDYDLDYSDDNKAGFQNGFKMGADHVSDQGTQIQGAAFIGMISYDFQSYVRSIQLGWVAENVGSFNRGLEDASPMEWVAVNLADCAALVPFGFETAEEYNTSRTGMITGLIQLQLHDVLFDSGCSNRVNSVRYAEAAGAAKYGMHCGFAIGFYEAIGQYFLNSLLQAKDEVLGSNKGVKPPYGYAACMIAGPWSPFNTRYRCWERCVKYTRQLLRSNSSEAKEVLELASKDLVLKDCDLSVEVGKEWARALASTPADLVTRTKVPYFIPSIAMELFTVPGVAAPELCDKDFALFMKLMLDPRKEEIHAIANLPEMITGCRAAGLAAAIRRASLWACDEGNCCDLCACRIGCWADACSYAVLSALMHDEPLCGPSTWSLQNYFVGAVQFWPVELPYLLSGFDLLAKMTFVKGAMGDRDVVDV